MDKKEKFDHLIGKSKNEVLDILGDQFNIHYENEWTYLFKNNILTNIKLRIFFDHKNIVSSYIRTLNINITV